MAGLERELAAELGETWTAYRRTVDEAVGQAEALLAELQAGLFTPGGIRVRSALEPYLARAKAIGGGLQARVQELFDKADAEDRARSEQARPADGDEQEVFYPALPSDWTRGSVMNEYCWMALWEDSPDRTRRLKELEDQARRAMRGDVFDEAMATADWWLEYARPIVSEAVRHDTDIGDEGDRLRKLGPLARHFVDTRRRKAREHVASVQARKNHKVSVAGVDFTAPAAPSANLAVQDGGPASGETLRAVTAHPNDITGLAPGQAWTVYVDESFQGEDEAFLTGGGGIMAGVAFQDARPLPDLPELHCSSSSSEADLAAADRALETVLHHPNCGVLAVPTRVYDAANGWDDALASFIDVVVGLLPFPEGGDAVSVRFCVEPHGEYQTANDFRALQILCFKSLAATFPERARRVRLAVEPLPKPRNGARNGNAYPDIVGHTCMRFRKDATARQRYEAARWAQVCHLSLPPSQMAGVVRCFFRRESLSRDAWRELASASGVGLLPALSARFGERARGDGTVWTRYLAYLEEHVSSGAIDMAALRAQTAWMARHQPAQELPKKVQLRWLTSRLACANHEGRFGESDPASETRRAFDELRESLFEEVAPLACEATLHLAVTYTNCFAFDRAREIVAPLLARERATVGLANYGKLLSSAGQHAAFLGRADEAEDLFVRALACFARLSEPWERALNTDITRAYRATAAMDLRPEDARPALALYLLGDADASESALAGEARRLAGTHGQKFHHHVLLRHLAGLPADAPLRRAYLEARDAWCHPSVGHPWELIEFYRAQLLPAGPARERRLERAYRLAVAEGDGTLQVIAAVIAGAALADGLAGEWPARFGACLEAARAIPGLAAEGRLETLARQPGDRLPPLELARRVLPFNFR